MTSKIQFPVVKRIFSINSVDLITKLSCTAAYYYSNQGEMPNTFFPGYFQ